MLFYHVDSYAFKADRLPAISEMYKTKTAAFKNAQKRAASGCWDKIIIWLENSEKASFIGGHGEILKELMKEA